MDQKHFTWKEEYSVNVKEIDEQHKKFISIIDDLYQAILNNKDDEIIVKLLEDLEEYHNFHFSTEEKYFDQFHYEGAEEHKAEHQKARDRIKDIKEKALKNTNEISFELIDFLEDWLVEHVAKLDHKYIKCFNDHGLF